MTIHVTPINDAIFTFNDLTFFVNGVPIPILYNGIANPSASPQTLIDFNNIYKSPLQLTTLTLNGCILNQTGPTGPFPDLFNCIVCQSGIFSGSISYPDCTSDSITGRVNISRVSNTSNYQLILATPPWSSTRPFLGFPPAAEICVNYELNGQLSGQFKEGMMMIFVNGFVLNPGDLVYQMDDIVVVYTGLCGDLISIVVNYPFNSDSTTSNVLSFTVASNAIAGTMTTTVTRVLALTPIPPQNNPLVATPRPCTFIAS
jgi:hypothetical protein